MKPEVVENRRPALVEVAFRAWQDSLSLLDPAVLFETYIVDHLAHEKLWLQPPRENRRNALGSRSKHFLGGQLIAHHLAQAEQIVVMICTIGGALEEAAAKAFSKDGLRGLALEAAGSVAVEALATSAVHHFGSLAAGPNLNASLPLSPGMINWPLTEGQSQVFGLLRKEQQRFPSFKVKLTESSLMLPRKSVTQVLGFGKNLDHTGRTCDLCSLKETCQFQNHYEPV